MNRIPRTLWVGGVIVGGIVILAILGPWIAPFEPDAFNVRSRLQPPSAIHWFGTDEFGRDVFSRVLAGAHHSLLMGFGATAISLAIGVPLGLIAAFRRGWTEEAIMRGVDLMISIPPVLLGLLILAVTEPGLGKTILAVGLVYVPIMTRVARAVALDLLAWPPLIVETALRITFAILLGSALSFLGLGPQPPDSEWGLMIAESRPFISEAPWIGLAPGLCLCVLLIAVNIVGEGLRDLLDPRLRGRGH
jgi:peptide/nickel transport system permease protein